MYLLKIHIKIVSDHPIIGFRKEMKVQNRFISEKSGQCSHVMNLS